MTQNEIIEMAIQAGINYRELSDEFATGNGDGVEIEQMQDFAKLVAAKEREEIAQFIEQTKLGSLPEQLALHYAQLLGSYATAIRARSISRGEA